MTTRNMSTKCLLHPYMHSPPIEHLFVEILRHSNFILLNFISCQLDCCHHPYFINFHFHFNFMTKLQSQDFHFFHTFHNSLSDTFLSLVTTLLHAPESIILIVIISTKILFVSNVWIRWISKEIYWKCENGNWLTNLRFNSVHRVLIWTVYFSFFHFTLKDTGIMHMKWTISLFFYVAIYKFSLVFLPHSS